jgi:hypothetical protein
VTGTVLAKASRESLDIVGFAVPFRAPLLLGGAGVAGGLESCCGSGFILGAGLGALEARVALVDMFRIGKVPCFADS